MNSFNSLRQLVLLLSPAELDYCRNYLTAFDSRGEKHDNKGLKLLNLLVRSSKIPANEKDAVYLLYGKKNTTAYPRLVHRLRDKLLDALAAETNVLREPIYNGKIRQRVLLRRRLNHADILIGRKQYDLAQVVLDGLIETAENYETFDELLAALRLHHQLHVDVGDWESARKIQRLIADCRRCISVIETANQLYILSKNPDATGIAEQITELRLYAKEAPSLTATYLLLGAEAQEQRALKNYAAENSLLKQMLNMALNNAALKDNNTIAKLYLDRCLNALHLKKFADAVKFVFDAERYFERADNKDNFELCLHQYHAFLYAKRIDNAIEVIKQLNQEELSPMWIYLKAVLEFLQMNYNEVIFLLGKRKPTFFAGTGLGSWPFILIQMAIISKTVKDGTNLPVKQIGKFRGILFMKNLSRREKASDKLIGKIIGHKLDFRKAYVEAQMEYKLLQSKEGENAWEVFSPELIPFDEWFTSMLAKKHLDK
jgi:hypothetical protein